MLSNLLAPVERSPRIRLDPATYVDNTFMGFLVTSFAKCNKVMLLIFMKSTNVARFIRCALVFDVVAIFSGLCANFTSSEVHV